MLAAVGRGAGDSEPSHPSLVWFGVFPGAQFHVNLMIIGGAWVPGACLGLGQKEGASKGLDLLLPGARRGAGALGL